MSIINAKKVPPITIPYRKGNPFSHSFALSGVSSVTTPQARVYRIGDRDKTPLVSADITSGITIDVTTIIITWAAALFTNIPGGKYCFELFATLDGIVQSIVKDAYFIITSTSPEGAAAIPDAGSGGGEVSAPVSATVFEFADSYATIEESSTPRIIVVAQDETQGGAKTVYIWDGSFLVPLVTV